MADGERRQLWNAAAATTTRTYHHCVPFTLPSLGVIRVDKDFTVTLTSNAVFTPECTTSFKSEATAGYGPQSIADMRDPFHASITPQVYATAAATVISWMLVIMLLITPRTFFVGGTGGRSGLLGRRGMISGATGGGSVIGVGTRPWLQKVAALTVAISLTLATADTFKIAEQQYEAGYTDALALRDEVVGGLEIKISRVISDIFLWLAQVQTLIRLFPRHKEKVIIKWTGFALIMLDIAFSCLNSFMGNGAGRPRRFVDAIPALSYLFQLALSMLYAAWVIYYSITKRRYAFYHSMMWNISIVALLSLVAILTPVVFFITDISNYTVAGWGDYFRWVGAAAASVIVWEWVERIEALEREERKDGILGREIFDGDEMLDATPSEEVNWPRNYRDRFENGRRGDGGGGGGGGAYSSGLNEHGLRNVAQRSTRARPPQNIADQAVTSFSRTNSLRNMTQRRSDFGQHPNPVSSAYATIPTPPLPIASPVSRTDTTSAASTIYAIRYHPISESPPIIRSTLPVEGRNSLNTSDLPTSQVQTHHSLDRPFDTERAEPLQDDSNATSPPGKGKLRWQAVSNHFKRRKASPPPEVRRGRVIEPIVVGDVSPNIPPHNYSRWALKSRLGAFAAEQGEKLREKSNARQVEMNLPVTIIPAQPRGRTWSPEILLQNAQSSEHLTMDNAGQFRPVTVDVSSSNDSAPSIEREHIANEPMPHLQASNGSPHGFGACSANSRIRFAEETWHRPEEQQSGVMNGRAFGPPLSLVTSLGREQRATPMEPFQATRTIFTAPGTYSSIGNGVP
ncbi:PalH-domain-containing protein [Glonium stellatum]|uniref:PalH-domain-containing protein n=1 Tax=Glonium stellatum TaxID=574774 RepID=A0A8E2JWX5_9PEZI|nr:PalH-domain-containing protein [Glonium stellatum]